MFGRLVDFLSFSLSLFHSPWFRLRDHLLYLLLLNQGLNVDGLAACAAEIKQQYDIDTTVQASPEPSSVTPDPSNSPRNSSSNMSTTSFASGKADEELWGGWLTGSPLCFSVTPGDDEPNSNLPTSAEGGLLVGIREEEAVPGGGEEADKGVCVCPCVKFCIVFIFVLCFGEKQRS